MATCKNCGKPLIISKGKCIYCGTSPNGQAQENNIIPADQENICPNCGISQPTGARFCNNCGTPMSGNESSESSMPLRIESGNVFCTMTKLAGGQGYTGTINIPPYLEGQKVTAIGERAFWGDSGLTSITIPNTVTHIGDEAFYNCGFSEIAIPDSVVSIGNKSFDSCHNLIKLVIPNSVISIGNSAFHGCRGLTNIVIPSSVRHIGMYAFYGCSATSIIVPPTVDYIDGGAFYYARHYKKPLSIVFPRKFLSQLFVKNLGVGGAISIKDEYGNIVKYEDLPEN